jgi:hypothetical protein
MRKKGVREGNNLWVLFSDRGDRVLLVSNIAVVFYSMYVLTDNIHHHYPLPSVSLKTNKVILLLFTY